MNASHAGGPVAFGIEVALETPPQVLSDARRFGLLLNQASVDREFRYAHELLAARFPGRLAALFGPQHGLWSEQQDNMVETPHRVDPRLDVPIHSLYSEHRKPSAEMLGGLDLLVVDLQDVGTRVYTYVWTLLLCLERCAEVGVPVLVLDRPNPLGGLTVEGPRLHARFESFVGLAPIPMRHALTIGELARWLVATRGLAVDLHVQPMQGWRRTMLWSDLGRAWVPTSPNLPRFEGVMLYPGQVLLEGTNLSEGRGTTTPFEISGAPWLDGHELAAAMRELGADAAIALRPIAFEPTFQKHVGRSCGGVFLHPTQLAATRSYRTTLALLAAARRLAPVEFGWRAPPYEYETERMPIDILSGSPDLRTAIDDGAGCSELDTLATEDATSWSHDTAASRLYD